MTISEIRDILKQETVEKTVLEEIMADERKGARQLVDAYIRRLNRESAERFRVEDMYEPESSFYKKGLEYVAGIDEVGRGPLAGPVTVAAVILKPHFFIAGLNDSKKVAPRRREEIAKKIHETAVDISIVSLSPEEIDMRNIYAATMEAMYRAVRNLKIQPQAVIVDAMPLHFPVRLREGFSYERENPPKAVGNLTMRQILLTPSCRFPPHRSQYRPHRSAVPAYPAYALPGLYQMPPIPSPQG